MPPTTTKYHAEPQLEYLFSYWATVTPPEVIGPLAEGVRVNVYVTDGEVQGPRLRGRFRKAGGDWLTLRPDGVATVDVRGTMELEDGALVYMTYGGVMDLGETGYQDFLKESTPPLVPLRIVPRYYTGHPNYLWLNRLQCIGVGEVDMTQMKVTYDIYAIR